MAAPTRSELPRRLDDTRGQGQMLWRRAAHSCLDVVTLSLVSLQIAVLHEPIDGCGEAALEACAP
jgi:hypothetical protein